MTVRATATRAPLGPVGSIKRTNRLERLAGLAILIALSLLFMLPLLITIGDSLKSFIEIYHVPRIWFPRPPQFENFAQIFQILPFHRFFINTVIIAGLALTGEVFTACLVGYSFARVNWPFRDWFFVLLLSTIMLPPQVTLIPVYILFNKIGWVNTWLPLIVPSWLGGGVFNIFLMRQFFKTIPTALDDAAKIDGCTTYRTLFTIMMPLAKPAIATIFVLGFIGHWNDFQGPLIYLSDYSNPRRACTCTTSWRRVSSRSCPSSYSSFPRSSISSRAS
jgi:ABC-type glycerol-3-phosphate transport system permease component